MGVAAGRGAACNTPASCDLYHKQTGAAVEWMKIWKERFFTKQGVDGADPEPKAMPRVPQSPRVPVTTLSASAELEGDWLRVAGNSFYRPLPSPNGRWLLGLKDSDGESRGGCRDSGNGCVVLCHMETGRLVHEHRLLARPVEAAVADNGCYVVADTGFGMALQGDLVAFGSDGVEMFRRRYEANIFNVGLSPCGRYAAVQTCNAPGGDGNLLEILDIREKSIAFEVRHPRTGWADGYTFDVDETGQLALLRVHLKQLGTFRYSTSGKFLDDSEFMEAQLERGGFTMKLCAARDLIKNKPGQARAEAALKAADAALREGAAEREDWSVVAHRIRGEALEALERYREAVEAYEKALALDEKAGVKRRVVALRKRLDFQGS